MPVSRSPMITMAKTWQLTLCLSHCPSWVMACWSWRRKGRSAASCCDLRPCSCRRSSRLRTWWKRRHWPLQLSYAAQRPIRSRNVTSTIALAWGRPSVKILKRESSKSKPRSMVLYLIDLKRVNTRPNKTNRMMLIGIMKARGESACNRQTIKYSLTSYSKVLRSQLWTRVRKSKFLIKVRKIMLLLCKQWTPLSEWMKNNSTANRLKTWPY